MNKPTFYNELVDKLDDKGIIPLDGAQWGEYTIEELFEANRVKGRKLEKYNIGDYPYVTTSAVNNGVTSFVDAPAEEIELSGITINPISATTFYQPYNYVGRGGAGSSIYSLTSKKINKYSALFISTMIFSTAKSKASYGVQLNGARLQKTKFMLPKSVSGDPDWEYMEQIGKNIYTNYKLKIQEYVTNRYNELIDELDVKAQLSFENVEWSSYNILDLFTTVQRGKRLKKDDHIDGDIPYVSSTGLNNGVDGFIGNDSGVRSFEDALTLANSGSVGSVFYHPYRYVASDHVHTFKNHDYNKYHYLFLATLINRLEEKYHFNREINDKRLEGDKIMLPKTDDGEPDWDFMETYMKKIELKQIKSVQEYLLSR